MPQSYHEPAPFLTGFGVQPKFQVAVIASRVWDSLSAEDREILRAASRDAVTATAKDVAAITAKFLAQACEEGVVIEQPPDAVLAALARRIDVASIDQQLLAQVRAAVPLSGPRLMPIPSTCRVATTAAQARALAGARPTGPASPADSLTPSPGVTVKFPAGTYTTRHTVAEFTENGSVGEDWSKDITWTLAFGADGSYRQTQDPDYPDFVKMWWMAHPWRRVR